MMKSPLLSGEPATMPPMIGVKPSGDVRTLVEPEPVFMYSMAL